MGWERPRWVTQPPPPNPRRRILRVKGANCSLPDIQCLRTPPAFQTAVLSFSPESNPKTTICAASSGVTVLSRTAHAASKLEGATSCCVGNPEPHESQINVEDGREDEDAPAHLVGLHKSDKHWEKD